jgi:hypothetical protein
MQRILKPLQQQKSGLRPGTIGVCLRGSFDPLGTIDTVMQGDTMASHVWWVLPNGCIATTGAKWGIVYGEVKAEEYLKGKSYVLLNTVDELSEEQLGIMEACHEEIMQSGVARVYGAWKFGQLEFKHILSGPVSKLGSISPFYPPKFPICSQAVAYCCWKAGIQVGKMFGKEDYTAVLPETFLFEAQAVSFLQQYATWHRYGKQGSYNFLRVTQIVKA